MDLWKYREWTVDQTCQYLEEQGLGEWQAKFRENNISGVTLQYLTEQHLKDMDIRQIGDRLKILDSIRKLWQITAQGKVFNDPIHGHIELHPLLIKIIDTPQFQRLRNIRQLGGAYFVYPGASHNRFEHSLGVAYLAGELVDALSRRQPELQINPSDILCVQFAGLCHDLGHGPFSHLFDGKFIPKARPGVNWKRMLINKIKMSKKQTQDPPASTQTKKTRTMDLWKYREWTVDQMCQYLEEEGLGEEWQAIFRDKNINGDKLQNLTEQNLKDMGIRKIDKHLKDLDSIRKLWLITGQGKVFNDPIHGHIELHPLLVKIIDTPQFQRLRNIRQLGGAYFVYPGASHNRFEHSLGVAYLAGELANTLRRRQPKLQITDKDIFCVQMAGLCHDLGHGPFSHLFDGMFIKEARPEKKWKHEEASVKMFDHLMKDNKVSEYLTDQDLTFIKEMIDPNRQKKETDTPDWTHKGRGQEKFFLYEIVSNSTNGIDVDKFDYFARDSHHLGIQNNFDHRRFLKFARVCEVDGQKHKHICSRDKEKDNLIDMFNTRTGLYRRACYHRVTKIIEFMINDAFLKADPFMHLSTAIDDMEAYTKLTDDVFGEILNSSHKELEPAKKILKRIITRDLYVFLGEIQTEMSPDEVISKWKKEQTDGIKPEDFKESAVAHEIKDNTSIKNIYLYKKDNPNTAFRAQIDEATTSQAKMIRVYWKNNDTKEIAKTNFKDWWNKHHN
ncbi:deoxynucleoside triphosphate triphosphohydrolase SAMHD1-like [Mastacembelus armatus]|uniref:deoxynucleoside triphosphate triphosphohydrolase SAMHD1-like n=1 Tax=Mastacembelus armatus TaxID=205130 RepID=UPI000E45C3CA|nr:deoxynucleoside triphosphate triphosphohydrolase SAMHD1-like [Mastacembelus armatus]